MTLTHRISGLLLSALVTAALWAQPAPAPGQPASLKGLGEDSTFLLYLNEATIAMAGQSMTMTTSIAVDADGLWNQIASTAPTGTTTCVREGVTARRTLKEKTTTFDVKPGHAYSTTMDPR
ncbi:MAG TPA: hypothetical protein VMR62_11355 [Bryobacteraceae bacterium]|jgi:hypothetical protein|nr:hypothetical protein [Bryobacteraceae bacterium]